MAIARGAKKGFSFIEITLTVAILGVLAVVMLPRFIDVASQSRLGIARQFGGILKEARELYLYNLFQETGQLGIPVNSFNTFVSLSGDGSDRNTVKIEQTLRALFENPSENVLQNDGSLVFHFKGGGIATYTITDRGAIYDSYSGF
jgi:prepilin-type N-terminal cleavage/methylation domain-containing protein